MPVFKVKDLMINVLSERSPHGGAGLCSEDVSATVPTPITPYVLVAANRPLLEEFKSASKELVARADDDGAAALTHAIDRVALDIGRAVVVAAMQGGGVAMPDPNCGGSSLETIPTPITPIVHRNVAVLKASHLGQLRVQLREALKATEVADAALTPRSAEDVRMLEDKLEGALAELRGMKGVR
ncbi:MAG TPA: hypothetical protein VK698_03335 [Kofleriaceae bacterium]|nr:hypothetical protein [Kofleriaceae bacterium]